MTGDRARVVFMGSPSIAVGTLEALARCSDISLVVTQPDRPGGRGRKLHPTAVNLKATELGIPVLAVENVNAIEPIERIRLAQPQAIVVVSFGQILKNALLHLLPFGCINVHFSLLPQLRGPAPVAWAIIRGLRETGVTIMKLARKMDAGGILVQRAEKISESDTTETLSARLATIGAELLVDTLAGYMSGAIEAVGQDETQVTYAPKITREMGAVDWARPAREIDCLIRGLSGQAEAYSVLQTRDIRVTLYNSAEVRGASPGPGVAARGARGELLIGAAAGLVEIKEIQAAGKRSVTGAEFANGYHITGGERFGRC